MVRAAKPFRLKEYSYLDMPTGLAARDLRTFLHLVRQVPDSVLQRHTMQCYLRPGFEVVDYPNDFAIWAAYALEDLPTAEGLSGLDPYRAASWEDVRRKIVDVLEERLWEVDGGHLTPPAQAFFFQDSVNFILETDVLIWTLDDLRRALEDAAGPSIYYHVHEAHQRSAQAVNDFSAWIESELEEAALAAAIQAIDFPYYSLPELRQMVIEHLDKVLEAGDGAP